MASEIITQSNLRGWPQNLRCLSYAFVAWKAILILVAALSPGTGYDTSTSLLEGLNEYPLLAKLVRWDAIYFVQGARHGLIYEQQWAFGMGYPGVLSWTSHAFFGSKSVTLWQIAAVGTIISHTCSWLSMVLIWHIAHLLLAGDERKRNSVAFVASLLYVISPAGIFLSAPYTESLFAALNLSGYLLFLNGRAALSKGWPIYSTCLTICAGLLSGLGTVIRSNGVLSGIPYAWEALASLFAISQDGLSKPQLLRSLSSGIAGLLTGLGIAIPQYLAWLEYCSDNSRDMLRPWCSTMVPSIFTFTQSHYWNVGLFKYWTVSNLPLFLLAAPTLTALIWSGVCGIRSRYPLSGLHYAPEAMYLAAPQLALAVLAILSYHVQIITRISSGYPFWYIWLGSKEEARFIPTRAVVRWVMMYGIIQAGLYACFLPPA